MRKGQKMTEEQRRHVSEAHQGKPSGFAGKAHTAESRALITRRTRETQPKGESAYNYVHGRYMRSLDDRRKPEYRDFRRAVLERDCYTCQGCGSQEKKLHVHHLFPFEDFPALRFDADNGLTLCKKCHKRWHKDNPDPIRIEE